MPLFRTAFQFPNIEPDFSTTCALVHEQAVNVLPNHVGRSPLVRYYRRTTTPTRFVNPFHREVPEFREEFEEYDLRIHFTVNPRTKELSKFGLDERRDILLYFALPVLEEAGIAFQVTRETVERFERRGGQISSSPYLSDHLNIIFADPSDAEHGRIEFLMRPGDRVFVQHQTYQIQNFYPDQYFGHTSVPMYVVAAAELWRGDQSATPEVFPQTDWREDSTAPSGDY